MIEKSLTTKEQNLLKKILQLNHIEEINPNLVAQLTYDRVYNTKGVGKYTIRNILFWLSLHGKQLRDVPKESSVVNDAIRVLESNGYKVTKSQ